MTAIVAAIDDVRSSCGLISTDINDATRVGHNANEYTTDAERALDVAERALNDAEHRLQTEGQRALREAAKAQERFGHQSDQMTDISREAREIAERYNYCDTLRVFILALSWSNLND